MGCSRVAGAAVVLLALAACARALQPLPPDSELSPVPPEQVDPAAAARLTSQAAAAWAERPDVDAVRRAERLYLGAARYTSDPAPIVGAVRAQVWLASHLQDDERAAVATAAVRTAQWCEIRDADEPACPYWLALAVGVQADARRSTAIDGVRQMVRLLRRAAEAAPDLEHAGPHRVLAQVLASAPGWPTGPGDPDEALEHAREAVRRFPEHAPNQLALAEAYGKLDRDADARAAYTRALQLAETAAARGDPDAAEWLHDAREGLGQDGRDADHGPSAGPAGSSYIAGQSQPNMPAVSSP